MYLITGGERSGKSGFAEKIAKEKSDQPMYVATARQWDADLFCHAAQCLHAGKGMGCGVVQTERTGFEFS